MPRLNGFRELEHLRESLNLDPNNSVAQFRIAVLEENG